MRLAQRNGRKMPLIVTARSWRMFRRLYTRDRHCKTAFQKKTPPPPRLLSPSMNESPVRSVEVQGSITSHSNYTATIANPKCERRSCDASLTNILSRALLEGFRWRKKRSLWFQGVLGVRDTSRRGLTDASS